MQYYGWSNSSDSQVEYKLHPLQPVEVRWSLRQQTAIECLLGNSSWPVIMNTRSRNVHEALLSYAYYCQALPQLGMFYVIVNV